MVRLLLPLIAIILVWLLFFSGIKKPVRILLSIGVIGITLLGLWFDNNGRGLREGVLEPEQIIVCGVTGDFSYRDNFNLTLCLQNTAERGTVHRIAVQFIAQQCVASKCSDLTSKTEEITLELVAGAKAQHIENLAFKELSPEMNDIHWSADVVRVWSRN